jgi:dTDP-4-amino-4,6-dideoxygalactose transaminase
MFYIILPSLEARTGLIQHLKNAGIQAVFHYVPLHVSDMGLSFGATPGDCPVTEDLSDRLLRLPFFNDLSREEQMSVIDTITSFTV